MPSVAKTFTFNTNTEGFVDIGGTNFPVSWDAGGSPSGGSLDFIAPGIAASHDGTAKWSGTWEDLGVPSGNDVTDVQCTGYNFNHWTTGNLTSYTHTIAVTDGFGTQIGDLPLISVTPALNPSTAWRTGTAPGPTSVIDPLYKASFNLIALEINILANGNASAQPDIGIDTLALLINYVAGAGAPTGIWTPDYSQFPKPKLRRPK
jgi:hypothetical protein